MAVRRAGTGLTDGAISVGLVASCSTVLAIAFIPAVDFKAEISACVGSTSTYAPTRGSNDVREREGSPLGEQSRGPSLSRPALALWGAALRSPSRAAPLRQRGSRSCPVIQRGPARDAECCAGATRWPVRRPATRWRAFAAAGTDQRAASGHAAAAPPSAASNSRRPMVTVIRSSRARARKCNDTTPRACCP